MTFLLTSGGHNAGIVAPPGEPGHTYRIKTEVAHATYTGPDEWLKTVPSVEGSWWPEWTKWLAARSGEPSEPPRMGTEADEGRIWPMRPATTFATDPRGSRKPADLLADGAA